MCSPHSWAFIRSQDWEIQLANHEEIWIIFASSICDIKSQRDVWPISISYFKHFTRKVQNKRSLCTVKQENKCMLFQYGKVNIPYPVKFMFQHMRIPNVPVAIGVNGRLPHFCGCRISVLRKDSQSKSHHLSVAVPFPAQTYCPGCLPSPYREE